MKVAVVGGGIAGLFAAWYLEREGADVTLFEEGRLGAGSVHAAGIIEPTTAYRTNTFSFLRRLSRFWRRGTCTVRGFDGGWLFEALRQLERPPHANADAVMQELSDTSVARYDALADAADDFEYRRLGLVEYFDDPEHFAEEKRLALERAASAPVTVREGGGTAGALFFPEVRWLDTDRFVDRMSRELAKTRIVHRRVGRVGLDGTVVAGGETLRHDSVVACLGVSCRRLGVPLTGVRGYGWNARIRDRVETATIHVDRGIAVVPLGARVKITGGWDFDLSTGSYHTQSVLDAVRRLVTIEELTGFQQGSRPCTPDGLPTVGRRERLVVATGGFRLGWSFGPALGRHAARLALDQAANDPFLARFCGALRSGNL